MIRPLLIHLVFMLLGYAAAVAVATTVTLMAMGAPTVFPDQGNWGSFYSYWRDLPRLYVFGLSITAIYALPGWLISAIYAEFRNERRKYWYAAAGVVTALLALTLAGMAKELRTEPMMFFGSLAGGFAGGLIYWSLAGRRSGGWKTWAMGGEPQGTAP